MVNLHIHRASHQPATRYRIQFDTASITIRHAKRCQIQTTCCRKRRIAANLHVQVYYDGCYYSCRPGKGCRR